MEIFIKNFKEQNKLSYLRCVREQIICYLVLLSFFGQVNFSNLIAKKFVTFVRSHLHFDVLNDFFVSVENFYLYFCGVRNVFIFSKVCNYNKLNFYTLTLKLYFIIVIITIHSALKLFI